MLDVDQKDPAREIKMDPVRICPHVADGREHTGTHTL